MRVWNNNAIHQTGFNTKCHVINLLLFGVFFGFRERLLSFYAQQLQAN